MASISTPFPVDVESNSKNGVFCQCGSRASQQETRPQLNRLGFCQSLGLEERQLGLDQTDAYRMIRLGVPRPDTLTPVAAASSCLLSSL